MSVSTDAEPFELLDRQRDSYASVIPAQHARSGERRAEQGQAGMEKGWRKDRGEKERHGNRQASGIAKGNQGQASQRESQGQASELRVTFGMLPNCHTGVSVHSARPVGGTVKVVGGTGDMVGGTGDPASAIT